MSSPKHILQNIGVQASKKLGQNFLLQPNTARKILRWANPPKHSNILEIGPGLGAMTKVLLEEHSVIAIEKDHRLALYLMEEIKNERFHLIEQDALDISFDTLTETLTPPYSVISNLPYSVSTPILEKLLQKKELFHSMCFLLQEEVVGRICASPNTKVYGRLSIGIQLFCEVEKGPKIAPNQFFPVPEVDSRLLRLTPRAQPLLDKPDGDLFLAFIGLLFQQRRKTLGRVLKDLGWDISRLKQGFELHHRAESLSIKELIALYQLRPADSL